MLKRTGEIPVYFPGDEEVYLKAADMPDGRLFCAVFNIGMDPIEELALVCDREVKKITCLTPDGEEAPVSYHKEGDSYVTELPCLPLQPIILFIS